MKQSVVCRCRRAVSRQNQSKPIEIRRGIFPFFRETDTSLPPSPPLAYPPLIHRMLHVFVQKHATLICHFLADFKKSSFNFLRKFTNRLFMLRFYDPKHATTPVIRRDPLCPHRYLTRHSRKQRGFDRGWRGWARISADECFSYPRKSA